MSKNLLQEVSGESHGDTWFLHLSDTNSSASMRTVLLHMIVPLNSATQRQLLQYNRLNIEQKNIWLHTLDIPGEP